MFALGKKNANQRKQETIGKNVRKIKGSVNPITPLTGIIEDQNLVACIVNGIYHQHLGPVS